MLEWIKGLFGQRSEKPNGQDGPEIPVECFEEAEEDPEVQNLEMESAAQAAEDKMREVANTSTQTLAGLKIDADELRKILKDMPPVGPIAR